MRSTIDWLPLGHAR